MGVIRTRNEDTDEYCVAQWKSEPYTLQENTCMIDYESPIKAYTCEIVCDALFLNPVHNAKHWFTKMNQGNEDVTLGLKQILLSNVKIMRIGENNKFPIRYNKS